jgi:hypothetical protein
MRKSKWIEFVEWFTLAAIALFLLGAYLTRADLDSDVEGRTSLVEE